MTATPILRTRANELVAALAGPGATLREDQWTAIEALVVHGRRALVVQRTGWGKSAVYFVAAKLLREAGRGPTVIVSPLLALMRNQVAAAEKAEVRAATVNSANMTEWTEVESAIEAGEVDVLLVSPERLNNPKFRDTVLPVLARDAGMVVIDEAHCISDWGHDFRPDYRRIRTLLAGLGDSVPVLATTATANDRVVSDIASQLEVGGGVEIQETLVLRGGLDRESLRLAVVQIADPADRAAWIAQNLSELPGSGIIYCLTVSGAHDLATVLREQGYEVQSYTGRTDPTEREQLESDLLHNKVKALVATSALGMGFDKPDLGFVIHLGAPSSPISYYQQIGRAGRAAERAEVVLLPGAEDRAIWRYFASLSFPDEEIVRRVIEALRHDKPTSTPALEPAVDLSRSRLEMVLKVLDVDGAVQRVQGGWVSTGAQWSYDRERYAGLERARQSEQEAMLSYISTDHCRMVYLRLQLDDPLVEPGSRCDRCDNCTGQYWSSRIESHTQKSIHRTLEQPGVPIAPRKQWPSGLASLEIPLSGKITYGSAEGRSLGRLTDLALGPRLRHLLEPAEGNSDRPLPESWIPQITEVLKQWPWAARPTHVVGIGGGLTTRPQLVSSMASTIARLGRMELAGEIYRAPDLPPVTAHNSAYRVAALYGTLQLPAIAEGSVILLVTDLIDTGWTLTLAAQALRKAGAGAVLPFTLAASA